jgi:hypothetical protein
VIVRRVSYRQPFGPLPLPYGYAGYGEEDITLPVNEKTAAAGLGLWILGGVLTHVAIRLVDSWFFKEKS